MNLQKFTQKSLEAIQNAQSMAIEYGNPQMDQQHLLVTLLTQDEGLIPQLMQKMNVNVNGLLQAAENAVKNCLVQLEGRHMLQRTWKKH